MTPVPLDMTDYSYGLCCGRRATSGVAVENGDTDLDFGDLPVEGPRHEALSHDFSKMHLARDAASALVFAPTSPDSAAEVSRALTASFQAMATALMGLHSLASLRGCMTT